MKTSRYNYIIKRNNDSYWYNGVEHTFFKLPLELGSKIENLLASSETIQYIPDTFISKLEDTGFLISDNVDELEVIRKKNDERIHRKDYTLTILPTLNCNFKCWYCIQDHIPSKMSEKTIEAIKRHIDYMIDIEKILSLQLDWFGGEPFMYFKQVIRPICEYAQYKCQSNNIPYSVSATTNGYFLLPMIVGQLKELQFSKFQITLDGPKAEHDKVKFQNNCESAFEHVLKNIENMLNHIENLQIYLRINYTEENLNPQIVEEISRIISVKNRGRIKITPKKVWQEDVRKERHYNVENLLELFEKEGYNTVRFDAISDFVPCYANRKYYTTINYNGDAVKCTACNDLYDNKSHGTLNVDGSIIWDKDFIKKYEAKSYENETCLACKYLPICMGVCPRDYGKPYCKLDRADFQIEDALVDYIEAYTKKRV